MRKSLRIAAVAGSISIAATAMASAENYSGPGFSGTVWMSEHGAEVQKLGDVHVGEVGFLMNMQAQGQRVSSLIKWESEIVWSLMHDQRMYMELPPEQTGWEPYENRPCVGYRNGEKVGAETVNGRSTEKWRCTGQTMAPQGEQPSDATVWYDPDLEFEIKTVDDSGAVFEIRNIEIGAQDASMFEIPPGYEKFDMNAMMQQMMQQGQQ